MSALIHRSFALGLATLLLAGCNSTQLQGSWRDPHFKGPAFKKTLVYGSYGGYYSTAWANPALQESNYQYEVYTVETRLFNAATTNLVWSGTTQTSDPNSQQSTLKSFAELIVKQLVKEKVL